MILFSFRVLSLATATVAAALLPAIASAAPILPDPTYTVQFSTFNSNQAFAAPGTYMLGGLSTTVTGLPGASLTGHAVGRDVSVVDGNGSLESQIDYSFAVDAPLDGVLVPLFVTVDLQTSASGPNGTLDDASARFVLGLGSFDVFNIFVAANNNIGPPTHPADFAGTLSFNQLSGQVGRVHLQIDVRSIGGGVADAFVDAPYIFVDPDFLLSNPGYSVIVSAGIGNVPPDVAAIPEPESYAMLAAGLGLLGFMARRRRQKLAGVPSSVRQLTAMSIFLLLGIASQEALAGFVSDYQASSGLFPD